MTKTILILAANPKDTPLLRLDREVREINLGLQRSEKRAEFTLHQQLATRPIDARRAMLDHKPNIVHFCGHGQVEGIAFEDELGYEKLISAKVLSEFFELFADKVQCVLLNACYSEVQAHAIAEHINYVIGMKKGIEDSIAIEFAVAFYDAIGAGKSVEFAYKLACNAIRWAGIPENLVPVLKVKQNNDKIDCVVLCGGYSVRLWPLTIDISKVLLPIVGKPVLKYALDFVQESTAIGKTILSVNQKFAPQIRKYADHYQSQVQLSHPIEMVVEPSTQQKEKLGPVGALHYIISQSIPRDLLVLGGDNIFGFRLDEFLHFISKTGETCSYNALYEYQDQTQNNTEYGIVDLDQDGNFLTFIEKPKQASYKNISTACYFFKKRDIEAIHEYIEAGENPDSLGGFIHWLVKQRRFASFLFSTFWFDVGTRETLLQANKHFLSDSFTNTNEMPKPECIEPVCIDANAKVSYSKLGPNVYLGPEVRVTNSTIRNSIIMEQSIITGSDINNSVIGSGSIIEGQIIEAVCGPNSKFSK